MKGKHKVTLPLLASIILPSVIPVDAFLVSTKITSSKGFKFLDQIGCTFHECDETRLNASTDMILGELRGGSDYNGIPSPEEERAKTCDVMKYCAKINALSAVIDFVVDGDKLSAGLATGNLLLPLTTLWKVTFSFNMWRISKLYEEKTETISELYQLYERFMISMIGIWRRTAFMVMLLTLKEATLAWKEILPNIRIILNSLYLLAGIISVTISAKETQRLVLNRNNSMKSSGDDKSSIQRVTKLGRIVTRSMFLCVSAFFLDVVTTPMIALTKKRMQGLVELLNLLTSVPFMTLLWTLRKSYIDFIEDLIYGSDQGKNKASLVRPEIRIRLFRAQQNFWGKLKSYQQTEILLKIGATLAQLRWR